MVFVGDPTADDLAAVTEEARAAARDAGAVEAVRDGISIARLVDMGDRDGAQVIADQYVLTLDDLAAQLGGVPTVQLLAAGYRLAGLCNAGDHPAAHALAAEYGQCLDGIYRALEDA